MRHALQPAPQVCADVGKGMEDLTRPQRLSLWLVLIDACRRCINLTEADNQDAKVRVQHGRPWHRRRPFLYTLALYPRRFSQREP